MGYSTFLFLCFQMATVSLSYTSIFKRGMISNALSLPLFLIFLILLEVDFLECFKSVLSDSWQLYKPVFCFAIAFYALVFSVTVFFLFSFFLIRCRFNLIFCAFLCQCSQRRQIAVVLLESLSGGLGNWSMERLLVDLVFFCLLVNQKNQPCMASYAFIARC